MKNIDSKILEKSNEESKLMFKFCSPKLRLTLNKNV